MRVGEGIDTSGLLTTHTRTFSATTCSLVSCCASEQLAVFSLARTRDTLIRQRLDYSLAHLVPFSLRSVSTIYRQIMKSEVPVGKKLVF